MAPGAALSLELIGRPPPPPPPPQIPQLCFPAVSSSCYSCPGLCSPYLHAGHTACSGPACRQLKRLTRQISEGGTGASGEQQRVFGSQPPGQEAERCRSSRRGPNTREVSSIFNVATMSGGLGEGGGGLCTSKAFPPLIPSRYKERSGLSSQPLDYSDVKCLEMGENAGVSRCDGGPMLAG